MNLWINNNHLALGLQKIDCSNVNIYCISTYYQIVHTVDDRSTNLNQNFIITPQTTMPRLISWLCKWSLELTGSGIVFFNYQPYDRQQRLIAIYSATLNSARAVRYLYGLTAEFKQLVTLGGDSQGYREKVESFKNRSAEKIQQLCEVNRGIYARMGQLMSSMTGILPSPFLTHFKQLQNLEIPQTPLESIKTALTQSLQKPMKQLFDGFQGKPFTTNLFYQTHRSILLQNYKESLVKIMLPSTRYQAQYDLWFINKMLKYLGDYIKQNKPQILQQFDGYHKLIKDTQERATSQIDLQKQFNNADKMADLIYQPNSSFYLPYYYKKYSNNSVIIRQFVQGVPLENIKGLKGLGLSAELAYALTMAQIHRMMNKMGMISTKVNQGNVLVRKYIVPAKRKESQMGQTSKNKANIIAQGKELMKPQYQIVFLNMNSIQAIPESTQTHIHNFWLNLKKTAKKQSNKPSVSAFYNYLQTRKNRQENQVGSYENRYYLYEPMLNLFEKLMAKRQKEDQKVKK